MLRIPLLALLAASSMAIRAQGTSTNESSPSTTTEGEITIHTVTVSKQENQFVPQTVIATPGDIVVFQFYPANHSVIRSQYGYPCVPYEDITHQAGFFSGFQRVANTTGPLPTWNLTINSTDPVWYYCGAPGSCIGYEMLGVINPETSSQLEIQVYLARQANYMIEPGEALPSDVMTSMESLAASATTTLTVTATSSPSSTSALPTTSSAASVAQDGHHSTLSGGAIAGIAIGGAAVLLLAAALFFLLGRNRTMKEMLTHHGNAPPQGMQDAGQVYSRHHSSQLPPYAPVMQEERKPPMQAGVRQVSPETVYDERFQSMQTVPQQRSFRFSETSELGSVGQQPPPRSLGPSPVAHELSAGRSPSASDNQVYRYQ